MLGIIGLLGLAIVGLVFLPFPKPGVADAADVPDDDAGHVDWSDFDTGEFLALAGPGPADAREQDPATDDATRLEVAAEPEMDEREPVDADGPLVIEDYTRQSDALVLLYDSEGPEPEITWDAIATGVRVFADGAQVALIKGLERLDPGDLALMAD